MKIDLVKEADDFKNYEMVSLFLGKYKQLGETFNLHEIKEDGKIIQTIKSHYIAENINICQDNVGIYQDRTVRYNPKKPGEREEIKHELSFTGEPRNNNKILERLFEELKFI